MPETTPAPTRALTTDTRTLGETGITVSALGVGTWAWGDTAFWGYGSTYTRADAAAAFRASVNAGINLFDTAEIYGRGTSERLLGSFAHTLASLDAPLVLASKFAPKSRRRLISGSSSESRLSSGSCLIASSSVMCKTCGTSLAT